MQQHSNFLTNTFDPWSNFQYLKCSGHHLTGGKGLPEQKIHIPPPKEHVVTVYVSRIVNFEAQPC